MLQVLGMQSSQAQSYGFYFLLVWLPRVSLLVQTSQR